MSLKSVILLVFSTVLACAGIIPAQPPASNQVVRTVTIPISILSDKDSRAGQSEEFVQAETLTVREAGDEQQILSIRSVSDSPLSIALLIQDDLASGFNLQIPDIQKFIRSLPKGTRVMTAYSRSGSVQIRQRFTDDLEAAAKSLRIVVGSPAVSPRSPYQGVSDMIGRFDAVPTGRRALLLFSDGLDTSEGVSLASISQSFDLGQALLKAQRKGVAVYSFYSPTITAEGNSTFAFAGQGALNKLSEETGGRAFFQGTLAPISFEPFFRDLVVALNRQFALTYLSTHMKKGYYKVKVESTNPAVRVDHPKGYYYR